MNVDGTKVKTPMLQGRVKGYIEGENFAGFIKSFKGDIYDFVALLPKENGSEYLNKTLEEIDFSTIYSKQISCKVDFTMPEFKLEIENNLMSICTNLGIKNIFSVEAGFTRVIKNNILKVESISHKAYIELDRKGKHVAEYTAMETDTSCSTKPNEFVKEVILDRPFIFAILHNKTGLPVFTGILNKR